MVSKSQEEYLKNMYILNMQKGIIRVTDVANKMNLSKASVNKSIKILKENGLVNYETYGNITLTEDGTIVAQKLLETYDIVYLFLKDVLNIDKDVSKTDAEKIKLVVSDDTINNLAKYVYSTLKLSKLDCCYDINKKKCRNCYKITSRVKKSAKLKEIKDGKKSRFIKNR